jgi:hypothetical protein
MIGRGLPKAMQRLVCAATASMLMLTAIGSSYAAGVADRGAQTVVPAGAGAMLQLRVPFGGSASTRNQASIALTGGPVWRNEGQAPISAITIYRTSAIELGISLSGQPVAKFGGIDLMHVGTVRTAAEEETAEPEEAGSEGCHGSGTGHTLLLIGLGALAVIGIASIVDSERDRKVPYLP